MRWLVTLFGALMLVGCATDSAPPPATPSAGPPPWEAPRHALANIELAGLPVLPLDEDSDPFILQLNLTVDGQPVTVPAYLGVDRLRAVQAPVHTHQDGGELWLEGEGNREVTLGQLFVLWNLVFENNCLAGYCSNLQVTADGEPVADPASLVLRGHELIEIIVES